MMGRVALATGPPIVGLIIALAISWNVLGLHIVHKPTAARLFGCEQTYINEQGEDTGECR